MYCKQNNNLNSSNLTMREDCGGHNIVHCGCLTLKLTSQLARWPWYVRGLKKLVSKESGVNCLNQMLLLVRLLLLGWQLHSLSNLPNYPLYSSFYFNRYKSCTSHAWYKSMCPRSSITNEMPALSPQYYSVINCVKLVPLDNMEWHGIKHQNGHWCLCLLGLGPLLYEGPCTTIPIAKLSN